MKFENRLNRSWIRMMMRMTQVIQSVTLGIFRRLPFGARVGFNEVPAMAAVILCYTCRRRVTQEEISQGLHNHPRQQESQTQTQTTKLASSDLIRQEVRPD